MCNFQLFQAISLTIIPQARKGSKSIAHEAEGRMGYWLRGHECFSKIQLVGQKYRDKTKPKRYSAAIVLVFKADAFR